MTLALYPFFSLLVLLLGRSTLMHRIHKVRFGVIYEDIDLYKRIYRIYPLIYALRRIMLVALLKVEDLEGIQVQALMYIGQWILVYVGVIRPFKLRSSNNQSIINEFVVLILTTIMVIFTDFCGIPETQYTVGWIYICIVLVYIMISIGCILVPSFRQICLYVTKYYRLAKHITK